MIISIIYQNYEKSSSFKTLAHLVDVKSWNNMEIASLQVKMIKTMYQRRSLALHKT